MNQDQVKEELQKLYDSSVDYVVIFSGKKSIRVNGLYKPSSKEIIIHNRNFANDNLLMYTAIHELAHHILMTEKGKKSTRAHTQEFWATFHDLLDAAKEREIYQPLIDCDTKFLIEEARDISKKIAELQRDLGKILLRIQKSCEENGLRYEDIVDREIQISKISAKTAMTAFQIGDQGVGYEIQNEAAKQQNEEKRAAIIAAAHEGKSVVQAKTAISSTKSLSNEDESLELVREKKRIERTIESLNRRLTEIEEQLIGREETP
ncbi:MAG: hypothetical protein LBV20_04195 [Treponema sp.]|nr:hypothetical protein [Treponema sp.]